MANDFEQQVNNEVEENEEIPSMEDMLAETKEVKIGDTVQGEVLAIDESNQLIVGIEGSGVEGVVPFREISSSPIDNIEDVVKVGDVLDLVVVKRIQDKENGTFLLSRRRLEARKVWSELEAKKENNETLTVPVKKVVKGGLVADAGVRGFIPASMVEDHFVRDFSSYRGQELEVKIVEINPAENRLILSHKEIAAAQHEKERQENLERFEAGQIVEGKVARLVAFGAFVDLGGIDGLVHVSEISYDHVDKPSDVLSVGDEVKVKILSIDKEKERISLSIKATQPSPWEAIQETAQKGAVIKGVVRHIVDFGAFVEVGQGVEGLVHISQISHDHVNDVHEKLQEGQEVEVKVLDINPEEHRLSLSIKALEEAPEREEGERPQRRNNNPRSERKPSRPRRQQRNASSNNFSSQDDESTFSFADLLGDQLKDLNFGEEDE